MNRSTLKLSRNRLSRSIVIDGNDAPMLVVKIIKYPHSGCLTPDMHPQCMRRVPGRHAAESIKGSPAGVMLHLTL